MNTNPRPLVRKETMQEAIIYFLTEIHPTVHHPMLVKFRNAIWMQRHWFFENPVVVRWMLNHMRSRWYLFETRGFQEAINVFFNYHIGVVAGGPNAEEDLQVLTNPPLTDAEQQIVYQRWNGLLNWSIDNFPAWTTIPQLETEMRVTNDGIKRILEVFYRKQARMFSYAALRNGNGFLRIPNEHLQSIRRNYLTVNIPETGGPNPQEVREYIMGLRVWSELQ